MKKMMNPRPRFVPFCIYPQNVCFNIWYMIIDYVSLAVEQAESGFVMVNYNGSCWLTHLSKQFGIKSNQNTVKPWIESNLDYECFASGAHIFDKL